MRIWARQVYILVTQKMCDVSVKNNVEAITNDSWRLSTVVYRTTTKKPESLPGTKLTPPTPNLSKNAAKVRSTGGDVDVPGITTSIFLKSKPLSLQTRSKTCFKVSSSLSRVSMIFESWTGYTLEGHRSLASVNINKKLGGSSRSFL